MNNEFEIIKDFQKRLHTIRESRMSFDIKAFEVPDSVFSKLEKGFKEGRISWDPFLNRRGETLYRVTVKSPTPEELAILKPYLLQKKVP